MSNLQSNNDTTQTATGIAASNQGGNGGGDMLDKGVDFLARKAGHEQVVTTGGLTDEDVAKFFDIP